MQSSLSAGCIMALVLALAADEPVKVVTDPAKAGPDFLVQGEYRGQTKDGKTLAAEVVALGDGKFLVNLLPGGLRGEGGDYKVRLEGEAKTESGKVTVSGKDGKWSGLIASSS